VLAALLPPAFDMRCSLSSSMSTAWSLSVKALAFVDALMGESAKKALESSNAHGG
jgi:hypothetical protein